MRSGQTYCPINDQVVWSCSSSLDIIGVLVGHVLGGETSLGVTGRQGLADLVPGDDAEGVVGPG